MTLIDFAFLATAAAALVALVLNVHGLLEAVHHLWTLDERGLNGKRRLVAIGLRRRHGARATIAGVVILVVIVIGVSREPIVGAVDRAWALGLAAIAALLLVDALLSRDEADNLLHLYLNPDKEDDRE